MVVPAINTEGTFIVSSPYDETIKSNEIYTVEGCELITKMLADNTDVFASAYADYGLTEDDMENDSLNNVPIITLRDSADRFFYVPANYIRSYPLQNGVIYENMVLALSLGALPSDYDYTTLTEELSNVVYNYTSREPIIEQHPNSAKTLISYADAKLEASRRAGGVIRKKSYKTLYEETLDMVDKLNNQIEVYKCYIKETNQ